jgi:N-acetylneuraminate synthase
MSNNSRLRQFGSKTAGPGHPVYVVGEIGINHNGELENAFKLIDAAAEAGCDAVKFQKRTPEICTPRDQWDIERDTPWGRMTYIDYRHRVEFGEDEYRQIDEYSKSKNIAWFASPWDTEAVAFLEKFDVPAHKVASASLTDDELLRSLRATGRTVILSTGMSTPKQIRHAVEVLGSDNILMCHATSTYPAQAEELNLRVINTLQAEFPNVPIGYSGHETGLQTTLAAVALGATFVERHITLDRAMWGSDQAASVEPQGLTRLVRDIRTIEASLGDGVKKVYESELGPMKKLRRVPASSPRPRSPRRRASRSRSEPPPNPHQAIQDHLRSRDGRTSMSPRAGTTGPSPRTRHSRFRGEPGAAPQRAGVGAPRPQDGRASPGRRDRQVRRGGTRGVTRRGAHPRRPVADRPDDPRPAPPHGRAGPRRGPRGALGGGAGRPTAPFHTVGGSPLSCGGRSGS